MVEIILPSSIQNLHRLLGENFNIDEDEENIYILKIK